MIDQDCTTRREEFYGEPKAAPPAVHLAVWVTLIVACLAVWGFAIWLAIHLI